MDLTEWWLSQFSLGERELIYSVFQPLGGNIELNIDSFIINSESPYGFLDNLCSWLGKHEFLQNRVRSKAEEIALADNSCDTGRLKESKEYKAWYYGRVTVLENYKKYLELDYIVGFEWLGCGNKSIPSCCTKLNGQQWNKNDPAFSQIINQHFQFYIANCCCDILPVLDTD